MLKARLWLLKSDFWLQVFKLGLAISTVGISIADIAKPKVKESNKKNRELLEELE